MDIITAYSHKGGAGKTTTLMMLASAIDQAGKTALLIDCDKHQSFGMFRRLSDDRWSDKFDVTSLYFQTTPVLDLEDALVDANDSGKYDYCLIDLPGTDHPFCRYALRYAELTILPLVPAALDIVEVPAALQVIRDLANDGDIGQARVLFTKMSSLSASQMAYRDQAAEGFQHMECTIPESKVLQDLVTRGLLPRTIKHVDEHAKGLQRSELRYLLKTMEKCTELFDECRAIIAEHK